MVVFQYRLFFQCCSSLARAFACAGVCPCALAAHGQAAAMPKATVAADVHQPLDVHRDLLAEVALDAAHVLEHAADIAHVLLGEILHPDVAADPGPPGQRSGRS